MRTLFFAAGLAAALSPSLLAQADTTRPASHESDPLVLDYDFTTPGELVRVFLQAQQVYRAELNSRDMTLEIRGVLGRVEAPRVYRFLPTSSPSGSSTFVIHPSTDAEYEIRSVALGGSAVATRLRLYRDLSESRRRQVIASRPGWRLGVEMAAGWHTGFAQSSAEPPAGSEPQGGSDIEACLTGRHGRRFAFCVAGLDYQSQRGARNVLWLYTEPRVGLLGGVRPGRSSWDAGILFRFGGGMISASSDNPVMLSPGLYLARHFQKRASGSGWVLQASYSRAFYRGFTRSLVAGNESFTPKSHRFSLGVGWYK